MHPDDKDTLTKEVDRIVDGLHKLSCALTHAICEVLPQQLAARNVKAPKEKPAPKEPKESKKPRKK